MVISVWLPMLLDLVTSYARAWMAVIRRALLNNARYMTGLHPELMEFFRDLVQQDEA